MKLRPSLRSTHRMAQCPIQGTAIIIFLFSLFWTPSLYAINEVKREGVPLTKSRQVDLCLICHDDAPGKAHARGVVRCSDCHLGDSLASDKFRAHQGMVLNPGDLRNADRTCGRPGCHTRQVKWVRNTLMATNRGIISTLMYYWGDADDQNVDITVEDVMKIREKPFSLDYFSKLCGTCHLWLERGRHPSFLKEKGGGCSACHLVSEGEVQNKSSGQHPKLTRAIPIENCVRCHNRSGRIGLSYQGEYETEGYGTPFEEGDFTENELEDGRYIRKLLPDIHYEKGLLCVDCHTQRETMGDGKSYAHMEEQLEIECRDCHDPRLADSAKKKGLSINLKKGVPFLKRKSDNKLLRLSPLNEEKCMDKDHSRLSCQACHSRWVPQCFGCHVIRKDDEPQQDWIKGEATYGRWKEYRSFMRYEAPTLGLYRKNDEAHSQVVIIVPG